MPSRRLALLSSAVLVLLQLCAASAGWSAELKKPTLDAFERYIQVTENRVDNELKSRHPLLWVDDLPETDRANAYSRLKRGDILIQARAAGLAVPGGLIHDWVGVIFVPSVTLDETLAQVQAYENDFKSYAPEVLRSKILQHQGNHFVVLLRIRKKSFVTVVLDVNNDIEYGPLLPLDAYSRSRSLQISEIDNAGTTRERVRPAGDDHGYLWRLYTYGRYLRRDSGVYIQFEAVALSREIPFGLGWLIKPYVIKIPEESLVFTLSRTRDAIESATRR